MAGKTLDLTLGGGGASGPIAPRVSSSTMDTDIDDTLITILLSSGIEATCDLKNQIDVEIDGGHPTHAKSVAVDPANNRILYIESIHPVTVGQTLKWNYNPAGACTLQEAISPNTPVRGGTYTVNVTGIAIVPHVVNFGVSIVNNGTLITNP